MCGWDCGSAMVYHHFPMMVMCENCPMVMCENCRFGGSQILKRTRLRVTSCDTWNSERIEVSASVWEHASGNTPNITCSSHSLWEPGQWKTSGPETCTEVTCFPYDQHQLCSILEKNQKQNMKQMLWGLFEKLQPALVGWDLNLLALPKWIEMDSFCANVLETTEHTLRLWSQWYFTVLSVLKWFSKKKRLFFFLILSRIVIHNSMTSTFLKSQISTTHVDTPRPRGAIACIFETRNRPQLQKALALPSSKGVTHIRSSYQKKSRSVEDISMKIHHL